MVKIYLHVVWSTKKRIPFLENRSTRNALWNFILHYGRSKGIYVDGVGGYVDHCHCLISLDAVQSIAEVVRKLKGASAFWLNAECLMTASAAATLAGGSPWLVISIALAFAAITSHGLQPVDGTTPHAWPTNLFKPSATSVYTT